MKTSIIFVSFVLLLVSVFTTSSNANTIALEKRSAVFPFETSLAHRIKRELDTLNDELVAPLTRVARQAPTDPETGGGGGISGIFRSMIRALALVPIGFLSVGIMILDTISQVVSGICNGINSILRSIKTRLQNI